jgi:hypothetical protein
MSRVSQKSGLSSSITKGSNAIDLGKNSGVDMGRKAQPSVTSGGIGITQEVTNIAGVSVSAGANVDITPLDFGISVSPSEGTLSISTGAEIPGGILGISGGIEVDMNTGQVIGGSVGGEVLGLGINVSNSAKGGLGIEFTVQIPGTPIELSLGFGFSPETKTASPSPTPTNWEKPILPMGDANTYCSVIISLSRRNTFYYDDGTIFSTESIATGSYNPKTGQAESSLSYKITKTPPGESTISYGTDTGSIGRWLESREFPGIELGAFLTSRGVVSGDLLGVSGSEQKINNFLNKVNPSYNFETLYYQQRVENTFNIIYSNCPLTLNPSNPSNPSNSSKTPFPNPPPRKRNMDECCRESTKLLRLLVRHHGATTSKVKEILPEGITEIGSSEDGLRQAYPFSVNKSWIDPNAKKDEKFKILNERQLTLVIGGMIERLESVLGTAEFYKDSDKKLRQSEGNMLSWLTTGKNKDFRYPDPNDFWLNTDDGVINEKLLEVRSVADGLRYLIEAINRLERILPIAELKDSSIPARWIYPNGTGQLRVGNLIHLCEYIIRKQDKDVGYWPQKITIKAANPAIKDDEPITTDIHSQGDMLRVILQRLIDVEGDGDMGSNYDLRRTYLDIMALQLTIKNNKYLQAITEYLSFDMTEEVSTVPIPFDPFAGQDRSVIENWWIKLGFGQEKLNFPTKNTEKEIEELSEKLLQNSELEINTVKFGSPDERKDPKTMKEALIEILKHSSAASAAVTEVVSEGAIERVVDAAGLAQKLASFLLRRDIRESLGVGDLDNWISSAEKGYTDNLETESLRFPESDPFEPYGRPATQNPVIREIDTKEDKAD